MRRAIANALCWIAARIEPGAGVAVVKIHLDGKVIQKALRGDGPGRR